MTDILAFDLGASSGRAIVGRLKDGRIATEELHRFPNDPVLVGDRLHWDILRLLHELKQGFLKAKHEGISLASYGIDTWGVDFGLLGRKGELLGNPYHYRDRHTEGLIERVTVELTAEKVFGSTGIAFQPFNTLYQLYALKLAGDPWLEQAQQLLFAPDLLNYFLTGEKATEWSIASTAQLYNPTVGDWDSELLAHIGIPSSWFGPVVQPGTKIGRLRSSVTEELGIEAVTAIAVAEHDTASAVVAVPTLNREFAYLSCGTWSLMGTETEKPIITEQARRWNFTNEGGAYGTFRLLKNIMGLWILQEARRDWEKAGSAYSFPELVALAEKAEPFAAFIEPDDGTFFAAGDMLGRIKAYLARTGQRVLDEPGAIVRCILESLALKYRYVLSQVETLSSRRFEGLNMVGGGSQNTLLCQWTANALGKTVWAGPAEGDRKSVV